MTDHTPTPWFKNRKFEVGPRPSTDDQSDGMLHPVADVFGDNKEADAAFIIKAVNNHQALTAQLDEAVKLLDGLLGLEKGSGQAALKFVERYHADVGHVPHD